MKSLRRSYGIEYIYAWHGLSAYWSGVAPASEAPGMAKYNSRILYAQPTPGLTEIEPSMAWNPSVISGVGSPEDPAVLFNDMHSYLAGSGTTTSCMHNLDSVWINLQTELAGVFRLDRLIIFCSCS